MSLGWRSVDNNSDLSGVRSLDRLLYLLGDQECQGSCAGSFHVYLCSVGLRAAIVVCFVCCALVSCLSRSMLGVRCVSAFASLFYFGVRQSVHGES